LYGWEYNWWFKVEVYVINLSRALWIIASIVRLGKLGLKATIKTKKLETVLLVWLVIITLAYIQTRFQVEQIVVPKLEIELGSSVSLLEKSASYIVGKSGTYTYMLNGATGKLDWYYTDSSEVINACIGNLTNGGNIFIRRATYDADSMTIGDVEIRIIAEHGTIFRPAANYKTIFLVNKNVIASEKSIVLEGFRFESNEKIGCVPIEIRDSTRVKVRDVFIKGTSSAPFISGILLHNYAINQFCESTQLENIVIQSCNSAVEFKKTSGSASFCQTYMENLFITMLPVTGANPIGIKVGTGCGVWRSFTENVVVWSDDGAGGSTDHVIALYVDGTILQGHWQIAFETFGTPTNNTMIWVGPNADLTQCNIEYHKTGTLNALVNNPNNKGICLIYSYDKAKLKGDIWRDWPRGQTSQTVALSLPEPDINYGVHCHFFYWNPGGWYISQKNATHFTVTVQNAPASDQAWGWFIFRNSNEIE